MPNANLTQVKKAKNDEFYTQYHDIEKEMSVYLEFDRNVFGVMGVSISFLDKYSPEQFEILGIDR